jgi:hypothetical protein
LGGSMETLEKFKNEVENFKNAEKISREMI